MTDGGNWKDLFKAAQEGNCVNTKYYLEGGQVDTNFQHPEYMTTPLMEALREGHFAIVKMLVEEGKADPTVVEEMTDDTALDLALELQQFDVVQYLYSKLTLDQQRVYAQFERRHILVVGGNRCAMTIGICQSFLAKGHEVVFTWDNSDPKTATAMQAQLKKSTGNPHIQYVLGTLDSVEHANDMVQTLHRLFPVVDTVVHHLLIPPPQIPPNSLSAMYALHKGVLPLFLEQQQQQGTQPHSRLLVVLPMEPLPPSHNRENNNMTEPPVLDFKKYACDRFSTKLSCCILSFLHFLNLSMSNDGTMISVTLLQQQQQQEPPSSPKGNVAEAYQQISLFGRCVAYFRKMILEILHFLNITTTSKYGSTPSTAQALVGVLSHPGHPPEDQTFQSLPFVTTPLRYPNQNWEQWTMNIVSQSKSQPPEIPRKDSIFPIILTEDN